jgi:catechol 2,3-dioxygenase-like lactoylglutathione lyase family enzyme
MLDHVDIRVSDREASRRFYTTVLGEASYADEDFAEWQDFGIVEDDAEHPVTRHLHVAFAARSQEEVDAFWRRGVDAGYRSDGEPGPRPQYTADYYGGFLLDPDGNSVEAVHRPARTETGSPFDHLWIGVSDLAASRRFYEIVAPVLGLEVGDGRLPEMFALAGDRRHAMFVADGRPPTEDVHLAFPPPTTRPWPSSTASRRRPALATTAAPASGPSTTPATSAPSSSIPTATTSRR